jgi:hypothetical protein
MNALSEGQSRQPPRLTGSATGVAEAKPGDGSCQAIYGPTIAVYNSPVVRPDARAALDHDLERFLTETDARIPARPSLNGSWSTCCSPPRKA